MAQHGPFVVGSVEPFEVLLEAKVEGGDWEPIDLNLYGALTPIVTDVPGNEVAQPGTLVKVSPQTGANKGKATYTPHSTTYSSARSAGLPPGQGQKIGFRCSVLDANNVPQFFPAGAPDTILIYGR